MKNILITGAFGYVGGRLAKHLASSSDYKLFLTSREVRDLPDWVANGKAVQYSLLGDDNLFDKIEEPIDTIVHLASINEVDCAKDPLRAIQINTIGSFKLLEQAKKAGVKRIIYFSTAHVYKAPLVGNIDETNVTRATHPYSYSHRAVEDYIAEIQDKTDIDGITVRLSNSLGAPTHKDVDRWMLLVSDLSVQAVNEKRLTLRSSGIQKRDFVGLGDVVRAVDHLINLDKDKLGNGLFNIGGENSVSVLEMAKLIQKRCEVTLGFSPELIVPDADVNEKADDLSYSIDCLKQSGFKLTNCIEEEIDNLLLFCQEHMKKNG